MKPDIFRSKIVFLSSDETNHIHDALSYEVIGIISGHFAVISR